MARTAHAIDSVNRAGGEAERVSCLADQEDMPRRARGRPLPIHQEDRDRGLERGLVGKPVPALGIDALCRGALEVSLGLLEQLAGGAWIGLDRLEPGAGQGSTSGRRPTRGVVGPDRTVRRNPDPSFSFRPSSSRVYGFTLISLPVSRSMSRTAAISDS